MCWGLEVAAMVLRRLPVRTVTGHIVQRAIVITSELATIRQASFGYEI
jgi:hypothetical protein